jgi:hypothetical protein
MPFHSTVADNGIVANNTLKIVHVCAGRLRPTAATIFSPPYGINLSATMLHGATINKALRQENF